ncbi:MAG TPA: hypothetical protein IAB00_02135 [Candidatus Avidehalobacter gallistercoris]|uniref:Uncharacterized protein n=1 Tax=Candidatus Avidehalobacter gallistercoris TaxID=2840694 RepID=A0A9D1HIR8_9FIRM|nr:hypothetical protein [Candidatus Avidehalobacter gallistercoris]
MRTNGEAALGFFCFYIGIDGNMADIWLWELGEIIYIKNCCRSCERKCSGNSCNL